MENNTLNWVGGYCVLSPDLFSKWVDLNVNYQKTSILEMPPLSQFLAAESGDQVSLPFENGESAKNKGD